MPSKTKSANADQASTAVAEALREFTGMRVSRHVRKRLGHIAMGRIEVLGGSLDELIDQLSQGGAELELMIREVTVGETYFFRGAAHMRVLSKEILPDIIDRARTEGRSLRIVSAGCATGEEPYTLAFLVSQALVGLETVPVQIVGIDISRPFVERAALGVYGEWSLRGVDQPTRDRCFRRVGGSYHLDDRIKAMVEFEVANLAGPWTARDARLLGADLVLCRNVLFYLEQSRRKDVLTRIARWLRPGGYVLLGPADLVDGSVEGCRSEVIDDVVVYRRDLRVSAVSTNELAEAPSDALQDPLAAPAPRARPPSMFSSPVEEETDSGRPPAILDRTPSMLDAMALADAGRILEAAALVHEVLEEDPEARHGHVIHGLLLAEAGAVRASLDSFRRAIYLESDLLLAHAGAAISARRLALYSLAKRHTERARRLAAEDSGEDTMEEWVGVTKRRLLSILDEAWSVDA